MGTVLLDAAQQLAREHGRSEMSLWVGADNRLAQRFYEKHSMWADGAREPHPVFEGMELPVVRYRKRLWESIAAMLSIDLHSLALFMAAGLALNLTPGPDMLYVAARGASEGRSAGIASALGIAVGCFVHITLVAGGLAALLAAVPVAYNIVRLVGAAYLIYLGVRALFRPRGLSERTLAPASTWAIFSQGVVTNVLNPKVAFFFLAFIPQFVDPSRGSPALQILIFGLLFNLSGTIVNLIVALGASRVSHRLREHPRTGKVLERITGALFIGLGLRLAVAGRR